MQSSTRSIKGFTIVELLIVIIVIGILATIALVSYRGVIVSSRSQDAQASASVVQKKLESYYSASGSYPTDTTVSGYTNSLDNYRESSLDGTGVSIVKTLDSTNGQKSVQVSYCVAPAAAAAATAYQINYYDFAKGQPSATTLEASVGTACSNWQPLN